MRRLGSRLININRVFFFVLVVYVFDSSAQAKYGGGKGTAAEPYQIFTAEHMQEIGTNPPDWKKYFKLMDDIDLGGYTGTTFNLIGNISKPFTGVFDANGHTISNFRYGSNGVNFIGIFAYVDGVDAEIKNMRLINPHVDAGTGHSVGSLVGHFGDGSIANCHVDSGEVSGNYVGGLVGYYTATMITSCTVEDSNISGGSCVGGLVGYGSGVITDCHSICTVSGFDKIGGLVGYAQGPEISNCYSIADVNASGHYVGGLAGRSTAVLLKSYSEGNVRGYHEVGGLVGRNTRDILRCFSFSNVFCDAAGGGLVGYNEGEILFCYATGTVSGTAVLGGLVGGSYYPGNVVKCYASGDVEGGEEVVGGLSGWNYGTISDCYATGSVVCGNRVVGGLVAGMGNISGAGIVDNCYAIGSVSGNLEVGGLVGRNSSGTVTDSFWDIETSGEQSSMGGIGLTTVELQTLSTFTSAGWDFAGEVINGPNDIWDICEGTNFPKFVWQIPVGDFVCPDGVAFVDFSILGSAWMSSFGQLNWNPNCDISKPNDNVIDERDLNVFTENWLAGSYN